MSDSVWIVETPDARAPLTGALGALPEAETEFAFRAWPPAGAETETVGADVVVVNADAPDCLAAAADLRSRCCRAPIVLLSFRHGTLGEFPGDPETPESDDHSPEVRFLCGGTVLPWFAPLYDQFARLPVASPADLLPALRAARDLRGRRAPLVDAAIRRAQATFFDERGRRADHRWRNVQQALRYLRGAQCARRVHPEDARDVLDAMKAAAASENGEHDPAWQRALADQEERWKEYRAALAADAEGASPRRYAEYERPYRLLVIDDQEETLGWRVLLERILAPDGFAVDGDDGLGYEQKIEAAQSYDVILLDLALENLGGRFPDTPHRFEGYAVFERLQQIAPDVPVILFTATERLSVARQGQQLGMVGYLVKSEQAEAQDALVYYNRLRRYCRDAIEHRLRLLLRRMVRGLQDLDPALWPKVRPYLEPALAGSDRPLTACHDLGLAFEAGLTYRYPERKFGSLDDRVKRFQEDNANEPYPYWATFLKEHRNAASHPNSGASRLNRTDVWVVALAVTAVLFRLKDKDESLFTRFPREARAFRRILLLRTAREIEQVAGLIASRHPRMGIVASLRNACECMRSGGEHFHDLSKATSRLVGAMHAAARYCDDLLTPPTSHPPECDSSNEKFLPWLDKHSSVEAAEDGQFEWTPPLSESSGLQGFSRPTGCKNLEIKIFCENTGRVRGALINANIEGEFNIQAVKKNKNKTKEHTCTVVPKTPPLTDFGKMAQAVRGRDVPDEDDVIQRAYLHPKVVPLLEFAHTASGTASATEHVCLSIVAISRVLDWIVSELLAFPHRTETQIDPLSQDGTASGTTTGDDDDMRRRPEIERAQVLRLAQAADSLQERFAAPAEEAEESEGVDQTNRDTEQRKLLLSTDPHRLYAVVAKLAPETLVEYALVRRCLREWVWTEERHELPILVEELIARWAVTA